MPVSPTTVYLARLTANVRRTVKTGTQREALLYVLVDVLRHARLAPGQAEAVEHIMRETLAAHDDAAFERAVNALQKKIGMTHDES